MAKALKIIGTVVAVVAIVAAVAITFGGAAATIAGISAATIAAGASVAAGVIAIASSFVKPPGFSLGGNPLDFQTNPQAGLPYGVGRSRMSGLRIHAETTDGFADKVQNDVLGFAVLLCAGGMIQGIDTFRADKAAITFNGTTGAAVGSYAGFMSQKVSLGGSTALSLSLGSGSMPGWTTNHKLSGMAHALWMLRYDSKGDFYQAGVPEPEWVGRWTKVYDPRLDSTYPGGSGSCRALDETTYVWSRNGALQALTWALGRFQNGKRTLGIGAPIANIRVSEFVEAANVADANNWCSGGFNYSTDSKWNVLKAMLQAAGAIPTQTSAMIGCLVSTPRVSVTTIESRHLLEQLTISVVKSRRERFNKAIPRYRSEAHEWEIISGSPVTNAAYVTADGREISKEVNLPMVQHELVDGVEGNVQAGQLAAYEMVNSREAGPITFKTGPEFIGIKSGDCVTLNVPEEGLVNQTVIIKSTAFNPADATISFAAETETASKHAFALGKTTTPPPPFTLTPISLVPTAPNVALWSSAPSATADGQPAITVTGASEYTTGVDVLIRYRKTGDANWFVPSIYADPRGTIKHEIGPLDSLTSYDVEVSYRNGTLQGPWLSTGPETTLNGALLLASAGATFVQPTAPTAAESFVGNTWLNDSTGYIYNRIDATGLTLASDTFTIGGDLPYVVWTPAPNQPVIEAYEQAAAAQNSANVASAAAAAAQAAADLANAQIALIDDDDTITISEKIEVLKPGAAALETFYNAVIANATAAGISVTTLNTKRTAWLAALAAISPAWDDVTVSSPVVRGSLDTARDEYDLELKTVQRLSIEAMTAAKQVVIVPPTPQIVYRDWTGVVKDGQYNRTLVPKIERGGVDIRDDDDVSYSITTTGSIVATVNNTTGSADKGKITATGGSSGSIILTVVVGGVTFPTFAIPFTNQDDNPPTTGGGGGGANTGGSDGTLENVTSTSFVAITQQDAGESVFLIDITSGETLYITAPLTYIKSGTNSTPTNMVARGEYRLQGDPTWVSFVAGPTNVNGTGAYFEAADFENIVGEINCNQNKTGLATGTYEVQMVAAKSNSATGNLIVQSGAVTVSKA